MEQARKWLPQPEIDFPCADVSYRWASEKGAALIAVMHFSRVVDGFSRDLEITFRNPLAIQWEEESFGLAARGRTPVAEKSGSILNDL